MYLGGPVAAADAPEEGGKAEVWKEAASEGTPVERATARFSAASSSTAWRPMGLVEDMILDGGKTMFPSV